MARNGNPHGNPMHHSIRTTLIVGFAFVALTSTHSTSQLSAAEPSDYLPSGGGHRLLSADMPAGYVGAARNSGRGLCDGYLQPVQIIGPDGTQLRLLRQVRSWNRTKICKPVYWSAESIDFKSRRFPVGPVPNSIRPSN